MKKHVLLCSHNGEDYITQQIESILLQEEKIDYIHIFDFGSTDKTVELLSAKSKLHQNIIIHTFPDAPGASLSFFSAMRMASEKFSSEDLVFLSDQDDVWLPGKVKACLDIYTNEYIKSKNKCLLIFHDVRIVDEKLNLIQKSFYTGDPYKVPRDLTPERVLLCNPIIGHTMAISGKLMELAANTLQPSEYLMHDWAITLLAMQCADIHYIDHTYSLYRQHRKNVLGASRKKSILQKVKNASALAFGISRQATAFAKDIESLQKSKIIKAHPYPEIKKITQEKKTWKLSFYLCRSALNSGPTIKRKILGLFFLLDFKSNKKPL